MSPHVFEKELPSALARAENLPSLPAVALEVLRIAQDEDATLDDMASCLSRDPALAAKLLRLANSSLFGVSKEVTTLQRATMLLGMKTVKLMALSFSLIGALPRTGRLGRFDYSEYWRRSLVSAIAARSLAKLVKNPDGDEAFLCGLLIHFGKLVLARCLPREYEEVLTVCDWPTTAQEEALLGFNSADVCATLLKTWQLPELIWLTVAYAARPESAPVETDGAQRRLMDLLWLATLVESVLCDVEKGAALADLHAEMERSHELSAPEIDAFLLGLESGITETAELLSIQLPRGTSHEEILEQARLQIVDVGLGTVIDLRQATERNEHLESEKKELESKAHTDKLTGLPNRAAFDDFLRQQVQARLRGKVPRGLGLILIDIDRFKSFNDAYGHPAGDEVLRMVGGLLGRMTRKVDFAARYGGEEFAVVLGQTNAFGLRTVTERLRQAIEHEVLEVDGRRLSVTASLGGACILRFDSPADALALIKLADHFLYKAKEKGRNRCEVFDKHVFPGR